jgi:glycosyltransferase involved in cell wall biosynthesis
MRILLATDCYPPPLIGGRDLHVRMLAHELVRRGHEVQVVTLAGSGGQRKEIDGGVTVHRLGGWSRALNRFYVDPERPWHPTLPDPGIVRSVSRLLRDFRPHVIHAHSWIVHSLLPLSPSSGAALVVTMHEYGLICSKNSYMHGERVCEGPALLKCLRCSKDQYGVLRGAALTGGVFLSQPLLRRIDRLIAVSNFVAEANQPLLRPGAPGIEVIPPFLDDEILALDPMTARRPDFVPPEGDYVMFAGALSRLKGIDTLLDAYVGLNPQVPLVVAGLNNTGGRVDLPSGVVAVENVSHDDVLRAWANCAVAVVPSKWPDPSPLSAMEAMAARVPVVASAIGGLRDLVVDQVTGILVGPGDVVALRAAIAELLADPGRRAQMGEAGRNRAADWTAAAVVPRIEGVYQDAVENARR